MAKIKSGKQEKKSTKQPRIKAGPKDKGNKKQPIDDPSAPEQYPISDGDDTKQSSKMTAVADEENKKIIDSDAEEDIDDLKDLEADGMEEDEYKKHIYE